MRLAGHDEQIGFASVWQLGFPEIAAAASEERHARPSVFYLVDCDQFVDCFADALLRATRVIDVEFGGVRAQALPVLGPEKWFRVVDGKRGKDAAPVKSRRRDCREARLGRFHHRSVERYDGMQAASVSVNLNPEF